MSRLVSEIRQHCRAVEMLVALLVMFATTAQTAQAQNYNEAKVPKYTLPDALVASDGSKVSTVDHWNSKRRNELMKLFRSEVYGKRPEVA